MIESSKATVNRGGPKRVRNSQTLDQKQHQVAYLTYLTRSYHAVSITINERYHLDTLDQHEIEKVSAQPITICPHFACRVPSARTYHTGTYEKAAVVIEPISLETQVPSHTDHAIAPVRFGHEGCLFIFLIRSPPSHHVFSSRPEFSKPKGPYAASVQLQFSWFITSSGPVFPGGFGGFKNVWDTWLRASFRPGPGVLR